MQKTSRVLIILCLGCFIGFSSSVKAGHAEKVANRKSSSTKSRVSKSTVRTPGNRSTKRMMRKRHSSNSLIKDKNSKYKRRLEKDTKSEILAEQDFGKSGKIVRTTEMELVNQRRNLKSQKSSQTLNRRFSKSKLNRASSNSKRRVLTNPSNDTKRKLMNDEAEMAGRSSVAGKKSPKSEAGKIVEPDNHW